MGVNIFQYFLSQAGRALLSENMIIVGIVLWTVRGSFKKVEGGLSNITETAKDLKVALINVESSHEKRIDGIEGRVERLELYTSRSGQMEHHAGRVKGSHEGSRSQGHQELRR